MFIKVEDSWFTVFVVKKESIRKEKRDSEIKLFYGSVIVNKSGNVNQAVKGPSRSLETVTSRLRGP